MAIVIVLASLNPVSAQQQTKKKPKVYDWSKLRKYTIDPAPEQTKAKALERYKECPPLRPERFRRRIKMLWGIDINDYPENALVWFGPHFKLSLKNQIIFGFMQFDDDAHIAGSPPTEKIYRVLDKFFLYDDDNCYPIFINYMNDMINKEGDFYGWFDMLYITYISSLSVTALLIKYMDSMEYTQTHKLDIFLEFSYYGTDKNKLNKYGNFANFHLNRVSELKSDQVYLYIKEQELNGRVLRNIKHQVDSMINIGFYVDTGTYSIPYHTDIEPWHEDTNARSVASIFSFLLRLQHKNQRKYVIEYMSGQLDKYHDGKFKKSIREQIRAHNYYGYAVLREFCENPEREMPTLEKVGTSFKGTVDKKILLYLEPYPDSYDIDTIRPLETFKAYEMGYDDYYFVEVVKPVESPIAGADDYAVILDRTETVYGYLKKSEVREFTDKDVYWEIPESNRHFVKTSTGVSDFVYKDRIKEKIEAGGWIIEQE